MSDGCRLYLISPPRIAPTDFSGVLKDALKDDRAGQHAISVNDQFRICFVWTSAGPDEVEFTDYH